MTDPAMPSTSAPDPEEPPGDVAQSPHRRRFDPTVVVSLITAAASIAVAAITVAGSGDGSSKGDDAKAVVAERAAGVKPVSADPYAQGCGRDGEPLGKSATKKGAGTVQVFRSKACHAKWVVLTEGEARLTFYVVPQRQGVEAPEKDRKWGTVDGTSKGLSIPEKLRMGGSSNMVDALHTPMLSENYPVMGCVRNKGDEDRACTKFL
ncbi:hypothetical protein AB0O76_03000 [Streptomyces sp. NPDC086554]|uniref:hypothetical protein n=1 Tax=Streptomyces sp. NPDC086554 TaxID=3154864 RepID=UPI003436EBB1